ncbi:MAG: magnesium transporter [Candidatus Brocadiia bacterium]
MSEESTSEATPHGRELLQVVLDHLERGRREELKLLLAEVRPADAAALIEELDEDDRILLFRSLDVEARAEALGELEEAMVRALAKAAPAGLEAAVRQMEPDEVVDVLGVLPEEQADALLEQIPREQAAAAEQLMRYPPDTAGGLMTTEFVLLYGGLTASEAVKITQRSREAETVANVFVADEEDRLVGQVPLHRLVFARPEAVVVELMEELPHTVLPETDQEELVRAATRYDLQVIPVTDRERKLLGVVTVDDILEAAEEEMDEDMYRLAGTGERDPVHASVYRSTRLRLPWLLLSVVDGLLIALLVSRFTGALQIVELAFFIPLIPLMGGQVAIQGSTIVVRALALGDLERTRIARFLGRQFIITLLLALCCSAAAGVLGALIVSAGVRLMLAVGLAVAIAIVFAGMLGMIFPLIFESIGIDPAVSSGPFITMLNDLFCISIYLALGALLAAPPG